MSGQFNPCTKVALLRDSGDQRTRSCALHFDSIAPAMVYPKILADLSPGMISQMARIHPIGNLAALRRNERGMI